MLGAAKVYVFPRRALCSTGRAFRSDRRVFCSDRRAFCSDRRVFCSDRRLFCSDCRTHCSSQYLQSRLRNSGITAATASYTQISIKLAVERSSTADKITAGEWRKLVRTSLPSRRYIRFNTWARPGVRDQQLGDRRTCFRELYHRRTLIKSWTPTLFRPSQPQARKTEDLSLIHI